MQLKGCEHWSVNFEIQLASVCRLFNIRILRRLNVADKSEKGAADFSWSQLNVA